MKLADRCLNFYDTLSAPASHEVVRPEKESRHWLHAAQIPKPCPQELEAGATSPQTKVQMPSNHRQTRHKSEMARPFIRFYRFGNHEQPQERRFALGSRHQLTSLKHFLALTWGETPKRPFEDGPAHAGWVDCACIVGVNHRHLAEKMKSRVQTKGIQR